MKRLASALSLIAGAMLAASPLRAGAAQAADAAPAAPEPAASLFAPPAPGGLTADEAAERAARTSHEVRARAEESEVAAAGVAQAKAAYVPRLSGVARYTRLSDLDQPSLGTLVAAPTATPGALLPANTPLVAVPLSFPVIVDQYTTQATLQVPLSDYVWRLRKLHGSAEGNARAAALFEEASRRDVATRARVVYYGWARAKLTIEVAERALAQAQSHRSDVAAAHATGSASKADVLRVESQVAGAELLLTRARTATTTLEAQLHTLMHDGGSVGYAIGEDLREGAGGSRAADLLGADEAGLVAEALERRPEPRALQETAGAARAQASAVRAAGLPRVDAVANAVYARPNGRIFPQKDELRGTWDASLQVSWAPTNLFGSEAGRSATLARARQIEAQREALRDGLALEVTQALAAAREAEVAIRTSERGMAAAAESYRVRRALFLNGRATSVELTDAENERSRAELEAIGARINRRVAEARLLHALGRPNH